MGIHITGDCEDDKTAALYDSVSGFAFGPTFENNEQANDFLAYLGNSEVIQALGPCGCEAR